MANMKEILTDLQLDIVENETYIDLNYAKLSIHYIKNEKIEKDFIEANVQDITQIISNQQQKNKPNQRFEYNIDKNYDRYEVFIDESLKDRKASFGIYYKDKSKYNY